MEFTITKEQILKLEEAGGAAVSLYLNGEFPEAFIQEITEGKWYVNESGSIQFNEKGGVGYGISSIHGWTDGARWLIGNWNGKFVEATHEEVESALIAEAKRRGYKKGNFKCLCDQEEEFNKNTHNWFFCEIEKALFTAPNGRGGACLFKDGKWAEITPTEKTVIPREKALKILAKKLKVSPEDIEIE